MPAVVGDEPGEKPVGAFRFAALQLLAGARQNRIARGGHDHVVAAARETLGEIAFDGIGVVAVFGL